MRDYKKYAQDLRRIAQFQNCFECYEGERTEGSCSSYCTLNKAADAIEELLAAVPKWISVEEKPIPYEWVWGVYRQTVCGEVMQHHKTVRMRGDNIIDQDGNIYNGFITHWMPRFPLPDPPKEVE